MAGTYEAAPPANYEEGDAVDLDWENLPVKTKVGLIKNDKKRLHKIAMACAVVMAMVVILPLVAWLVSTVAIGYHEAKKRTITPWGFEWRDTEYVGKEGAAVYSDKELSSSRRLFMGRRLEETEPRDWLVGLKTRNVSQATVEELLARLGDGAKVSTAKSAAGNAVSILVQAETLAKVKEMVKDVEGVAYVEQDLAAELVPDQNDELPFTITDKVDSADGERLLAGDKILNLYSRVHDKRRLASCEQQHYPPWGLDRIDKFSSVDYKYGCHADSLGHGKGVSVYVIDTGIRYTHEDFEGRAFPALSYKTGSMEVCAKTDFTCASDDNGHGTHCAALVAGKKYGVAKEATVYGVRVMDADGHISMNWVCQSVDWIVEKAKRPTVVSISLQSTGNYLPILEALTRATDDGIPVVVAAGNNGNTDVPEACDYSPAYVPMAITVGSIDQGDIRSSYSNYGSCIDIFAPGRAIQAASHHSDDGEATMSGTSQATPLVAGACALLLGHNPNLTTRQVTTLLSQGASEGLITDEKDGSPDLILFVGVGFESLADHPETFEAADGGINRACRGRNEDDGTVISEMWGNYFSTTSYDVENTESREHCESLCKEKDACVGYEYKFEASFGGFLAAGRCELWNRQVQTTAPHEGFECYRRSR